MAEILVTGAGGHLGSVLMATALQDGASCLGTVSPEGPRPDRGETVAIDLRQVSTLAGLVLRERPKVIIHLAAITAVEQARREPIQTHELNVELTSRLSELAEDVDARLVFASTDMVFDGSEAPYAEHATPNPLSNYGRSKLVAEAHVMRNAQAVIARLPLLFGVPHVTRAPAFFGSVAAALRSGECPPLFVDEFRTPLSYDDAARALLKLSLGPLSGVVHLPGAERLSRFQMGTHLAAALGVDTEVRAARLAEVEFAEPRPSDLTLLGDRYETAFGEGPGRPTEEVFADLAEQYVARLPS